MPFHTPSLQAGGDIRPHRFIKYSTSADNTALEADANEFVIGISTEATQDAPLPCADGDAAESGDQVHYYPTGTECLLEIGSGGVTRGAWIKSDADGKGVLAATTGATAQFYGAFALESASEGEFARVLVWPLPKVYPALA